jgi:hypothetical protein
MSDYIKNCRVITEDNEEPVVSTIRAHIIGGYPFGVMSLSSPKQVAIGYYTLKGAIAQAKHMNILRRCYDTHDWIWNKSYWITKPDKFVVVTNM